MVEDIDARSARRVVLNGKAPLGAEAIRKQHPHTRPEHTKKSPAPAVHAASKAVRKQMKEAYRLFVTAYREAAARLRAGDLTVDFPPGCFPPAGPFVPADAGRPVAARDRPGHLDRLGAALIAAGRRHFKSVVSEHLPGRGAPAVRRQVAEGGRLPLVPGDQRRILASRNRLDSAARSVRSRGSRPILMTRSAIRRLCRFRWHLKRRSPAAGYG